MKDSTVKELANDAWLAGFTAGEGSFNICPSYKETLIPRFKISLRADDLAILEDLCDAFGGYVSPTASRSNPAVQWQVAKKRDLLWLLDYFDRFPLRAKKAQDYRIWRLAVRAYVAQGSCAPELPVLREALRQGRQFAAEESELPAESPQLRLVG